MHTNRSSNVLSRFASRTRVSHAFALAACGLALALAGCGGGGGGSTSAAADPAPADSAEARIQVSLTASQTTLAPGATTTLTAGVSGNRNTAVTWTVNGILSGNATVGTIAGAGDVVTYKAPSTPGVYTICATSVASTTKSATIIITVQSAVAAAPSGLSYPQGTLNAIVGQAVVADTPSVTGTVTTWSVSPSLPAGFAFSSSTGTISGTPTATSPSTAYTVTAANGAGSTTATVTISATAAAQATTAGFTALFQHFPGSLKFASAQTSTVMAANPWMKGARFWLAYEGLCQDTQLSLSNWNSDVSNVANYTDPMNTVMVRMNANPSGTWNIQNTSAVTNMDASVAGVVSVAQAAKTNNILLDLENYYTSFLLNDYDQTSAGNPLLNSPALTRAQMCAKARSFGQSVGNSLWSRMPNATLYTFFGPTFVMSFTNGGTGIPTSYPDASYASDPRYNMIPYFFLGLLDTCPTTGHIADYIERSYYDFTGLASIQRNMTASKNWVSIFFPTETADIAKSATCWVPLPLIFANPYFDANYGSIYPGAKYVTNVTDQQNYFTRNALYCLQQTPAGFLPGIYIEGYDPWDTTGTVSNIPANWQTCLQNAMDVYKGNRTLASLFDVNALDTTLQNAFSGNSAWKAECK